MTERYAAQVVHYGGGFQTAAMLVLIGEGVIPRPDRVVIADTGLEVRSTWDYLENHARPYLLAKAGLDIEVAPHSLATVDLYSHKGTLLLPVFTETGKFSAYCSGEWKTAVCRRYLRSQGITTATSWIGYAYDEKARWWQGGKKATEDGPWRIAFPLVERRIVKADCPVIIRKAGLPLPKKSRCKCCPNQPNAEWRDLRDNSPAEFEDACRLEDELREEDPGVYFHESRVPLRQADLDAPDRKEPSRQCTLGICFV